MAKNIENKRDKIINNLYSQIIKTYKYDRQSQEIIEKIMKDKSIQDDISNIIKNKNTLTKEEITAYHHNYYPNIFVIPLLFECKNVPIDIVKNDIKSVISSLSLKKSYGFISNNTEIDGLLKAILSVDLPQNVRIACADELTKMYVSSYLSTYVYFKINGQTALTIAEKLYYDLKSPIDKISIIKHIHPDESLSKEELLSRLEEMVNWDIDEAIEFLPDKKDSQKAKEQRYTAILNNPNINDAIIDKIYETGDFDPYNIPEKLSTSMANEVYSVLSDTLFNEEVDKREKRLACTPFLAFCKSGKFNFAQQYDFFQQMKTEYKADMRDIADRAIFDYLYYCENLNPEAIKTIIQFASKGTQSRIFTLPNIPKDIKSECASTYIEETVKNKIVKSNRSLMLGLSVVGKMMQLDEARYEEIFKNKEKLQREPRFTEFYDAIKTSPQTPLKYLEKFETFEPNNIAIHIAKYGNKNNLSSETTDTLYKIMMRDFDGNARKATINVNLYETVLNNSPNIDIQDFIKYMQDLCNKNHTIKSEVGQNLKSFDSFVNEYTIKYNSDKDYYISSKSPSQFYSDQQKEIINEITKFTKENVKKTQHQVIKSLIEKQDEYVELMIEKSKSQSPNAKTYVDMNELIDTGITYPTSTTTKDNQPQFLDEFLEER